MHNEKSLFYWVFKARLFPNCSILEAKNSKSGSYAWKSILKGWEVIKKGAKWSVGNGSSIKIWSDSWLPGNGNGKVLTPVVDSMRVITVDLFIDSHHRQWKGSIIGSLLDPQDAEKIKTFPLAGLLLVILYFWPFTQNGDYACKSGYRFLCKHSDLQI